MQRGGLARTGGAADVKQAIGLFNGSDHPLHVVRGQAQFIQRNGLTGGQNPHHHVFDTAGRGNGGHTQFDIERAVLLELDLAVLRLAALGNIEVAHDLQARHHGLAEMRRHLDIGLQRAVDAKADAGLELARHGLDVDVGHLLVVGIDDDLVDKLDQFIVGRGRLQRIVVAAIIQGRAVHVGQHLVDAAALSLHAKELAQGLHELGVRGDAVRELADARKHLRTRCANRARPPGPGT